MTMKKHKRQMESREAVAGLDPPSYGQTLTESIHQTLAIQPLKSMQKMKSFSHPCVSGIGKQKLD